MSSVITSTSLLSLSVVWEKVGVGRWRARVQDTDCVLQMNDFPEEPLYTVSSGDFSIDLEDAPDKWIIR
jgi:hypothetical protein